MSGSSRRYCYHLNSFYTSFNEDTPKDVFDCDVKELVMKHCFVANITIQFFRLYKYLANNNEYCYYFLNKLQSMTKMFSFPRLQNIEFAGPGLSMTNAHGAQLIFQFIKKLDSPCTITIQDARLSFDAIQCLCAGKIISSNSDHDDTLSSSSSSTTYTTTTISSLNNSNIKVPQYYYKFSFDDCVWLDEPCMTISGGYSIVSNTYIMKVIISKIKMDGTVVNQLMQALTMLENNSNIVIQTIQFKKVSLSFEVFEYLRSPQVRKSKDCNKDNNGPKKINLEYTDCKLFCPQQPERRQEENAHDNDDLQQGEQNNDPNNTNNNNDNKMEQDEMEINEEYRSLHSTIKGSFSVESLCQFFGFFMGTQTRTKLLRPILEDSINSRKLKLLNISNIKFSIETMQYLLSPILVNQLNKKHNRYMHVPFVQFIDCQLLEDYSNCNYSFLPNFKWVGCKGRIIKVMNCYHQGERSNLALIKFLTKCSIFKSVDTLELNSPRVREKDLLELLQILQNDNNNNILPIKKLHLNSPDFTDVSANHLATLLEARTSNQKNKNMDDNDNTTLLHVDIGFRSKITEVGAWRLVHALKINHYVTMKYKSKNSNKEYEQGFNEQEVGSTTTTAFQILQENIIFYSTLNRIGRGQLSMKIDQISACMFATVLEKANHNHSILFWLLQTFPHVYQ